MQNSPFCSCLLANFNARGRADRYPRDQWRSCVSAVLTLELPPPGMACHRRLEARYSSEKQQSRTRLSSLAGATSLIATRILRPLPEIQRRWKSVISPCGRINIRRLKLKVSMGRRQKFVWATHQSKAITLFSRSEGVEAARRALCVAIITKGSDHSRLTLSPFRTASWPTWPLRQPRA